MEDTVDTKSNVADGNTNSSAFKRHRNWFLTLNNYTEEEINTITQRLELLCAKYAWQEEEGEEGTKHIQGVFALKSAKSFDAMKKLLERGHWEVCRNIKAAGEYCSKFDTRIGAPHVMGFIKKKKSPINTPYEWQEKLLNELKEEPDDRKIIWYVDPKGGSGKTALCKHICAGNELAIMVSGKANDVKCAIARMYQDGKEVEIVLFNIVRTMENYVSYDAIESVKDGIFFSGKYESGMVNIDSPHVVIFANFHPDEEKLTEDRWDIRVLSQ